MVERYLGTRQCPLSFDSSVCAIIVEYPVMPLGIWLDVDLVAIDVPGNPVCRVDAGH
jgi:hypothetical protein